MRVYWLLLAVLPRLSAADLPDIPERVCQSQYRVGLYANDSRIQSGTATGIDKHRLVTARHVVHSDDFSTVDCRLDVFDKNGIFTRQIMAKIEKLDDENDLALLSVAEDLPAFAELGDSGGLKVGQWIYCMGSVFGSVPTNVSVGILASKSCPAMPGLMQAGCSSGDRKSVV